MKNILTCCLVVLNIITTPLAFAADKYEIRINPVLVRSEWRGPSTESIGVYEQGFVAPGKAGKPTLVPIKMGTPAEQKKALETLRIVMKSRNSELNTARSNVAAHVDAYARSHTDHRENRYIHNHTTGTVQHNHNHAGVVQHTGLVQHQYTGGYVSPSCSPSRGAFLGGNRYHYRYNNYHYRYGR
jgi:hypothetical protein